MKRKWLLPVLAVAAVLLAAPVGRAWGYFTTYAEAKGYKPVTLGHQTRIREEFSEDQKTVTIYNEGPQDAYVRVGVFSGSVYSVDAASSGGAGWTKVQNGAGDWWEYGEFLPGTGEEADRTAAPLIIKLEHPDDLPEEMVRDYDVIVVYESVAVEYEGDAENKVAKAPNWDVKVQRVTDAGGES